MLFRHADEAHHKRGIAETLELCKAEPPTTDLETLDILFKTLQKMDGQGDMRASLWDKAAKTKPQDLEIQLQWFNIAFTDNDFKSAQKVSPPKSIRNETAVTDELFPGLGCHESAEELPQGAQVLLLGNLPLTLACN